MSFEYPFGKKTDSLAEQAWEELNDIADEAEEILNLHASTIHERLVDMMKKTIVAVRTLNMDALNKLAFEDFEFAYTKKIRDALTLLIQGSVKNPN
jgi:hypothetical protein